MPSNRFLKERFSLKIKTQSTSNSIDDKENPQEKTKENVNP